MTLERYREELEKMSFELEEKTLADLIETLIHMLRIDDLMKDILQSSENIKDKEAFLQEWRELSGAMIRKVKDAINSHINRCIKCD